MQQRKRPRFEGYGPDSSRKLTASTRMYSETASRISTSPGSGRNIANHFYYCRVMGSSPDVISSSTNSEGGAWSRTTIRRSERGPWTPIIRQCATKSVASHPSIRGGKTGNNSALRDAGLDRHSTSPCRWTGISGTGNRVVTETRAQCRPFDSSTPKPQSWLVRVCLEPQILCNQQVLSPASCLYASAQDVDSGREVPRAVPPGVLGLKKLSGADHGERFVIVFIHAEEKVRTRGDYITDIAVPLAEEQTRESMSGLGLFSHRGHNHDWAGARPVILDPEARPEWNYERRPGPQRNPDRLPEHFLWRSRRTAGQPRRACGWSQ